PANRLFCESPSLVEFCDDLCFVCRRLLEGLSVEIRWWRGAHQAQYLISLASHVHQHFGKGSRVLGWLPRKFIRRYRVREVNKFLLHSLQVQQCLRLQVVAGSAGIC